MSRGGANRGIALLDYFDAFILGLTATPSRGEFASVNEGRVEHPTADPIDLPGRHSTKTQMGWTRRHLCDTQMGMATPGQLVRTMATVLGIPEPTVIQYDRHLAEAGLRRIRGRGTSAAAVSAEDAANLLIAILGSPVVGASIRTAADTSKVYGSLVAYDRWKDPSRFADYGLTTLSKIPKDHTLKDALVAAIEGASRGESPYITERNDVLMELDFLFGVNVQTPNVHAEIIFDSLSNNEARRYMRLVYNPLKQETETKASQSQDLNQDRQVSFRTIRTLGTLIAIPRNPVKVILSKAKAVC